MRAAADLYDIVSATVTLKPSGTGTFVGLCPFHDEKPAASTCVPRSACGTASAAAWVATYSNYVEQSENIDFREAVELLADKYHIELHYENSGNGPALTKTLAPSARDCWKPARKPSASSSPRS